MAGAAPGSIIAAIIVTHAAAKNQNDPGRVATPISMPSISQAAITQHAAESPSIAVSTGAVSTAPAPVTAAGRDAGSVPGRSWRGRPRARSRGTAFNGGPSFGMRPGPQRARDQAG